MANALAKKLRAELSTEERATCERKQAAISVIIASRKAGDAMEKETGF
jgi:hypothetical protein